MPRPASPLGEAGPIGAFWLRLRWCGERKHGSYRRCRCERDRLGTRSIAVQGTTKSMASLAITIVETRQLIVGAVSVAHAMVVMGVVADMKSLRFLFVLAIRRRRSPDGLQRKQYQEEDGNPATHKFGV